MSEEEQAALIAGMTEIMWEMALFHQSDRAEYYRRAMRDPLPGRLVVEMTTRGYPAGDARMVARGWEDWRGPLDRVGTLLRIEARETPDEDGEMITTRWWIIRTLDGQERAWHNAQFVGVALTAAANPGRLGVSEEEEG